MSGPELVTSFEHPYVAFALALEKADAFPVLHPGRDKMTAAEAVKELSDKCKRNFNTVNDANYTL